MSGAGVGGFGLGGGGSIDSLQRADANQQTQQPPWSADAKAASGSPADVGRAAAVPMATSTDPTRGNAALNQDSPGLLGSPARVGGGPQQAADGFGQPSDSTTNPLSAGNPVRPVDQAMGGQGADPGDFHPVLSQGPLPRQVTDALEAAGYRANSSGQAGVTANAEEAQPAAQPSDPAPAVSDPQGNSPQSNSPQGNFAQLALPGGSAVPFGGAEPGALASVGSRLFGTGALSQGPDGALASGAPQTLQQALAATASPPPQAALTAEVAVAPTAADTTLPLSGPGQGTLASAALAGADGLAGPSPSVMATPIEPVFGVPGAAFMVNGAAFAAETTGVAGLGSTGGAPAIPNIGVSNASVAPLPTAPVPALDPRAVAGLTRSFMAPGTKTSPAVSAVGSAMVPSAVNGEAGPVTAVAPIPGSLTPAPPPPVQIPPANPGPAAEAGMGALPGGTPLAQTSPLAQSSPLPGLTTNPGTAGLASPMAARPATLAAVPPGAWAYGFGPLPKATPQALLTPGIATATSTNSRGRRPVDGGMIAYAEHRPVLLDLAPVEPEAPSWRLDDTQTLVSVGAAGVAAARQRAVALYAALLEQGEGLAALRPGEGFATWDGSPLWLSLAGIAKPGQHGVLPNVAVPGRVQVQRTAMGEWLVEHTGHAVPMSRPMRHEAASVDDDSLSSDVLYGVTGVRGDSDRSRRFEQALSALRFAFGLAPPARWRSAEAWASVARLCAISATRVSEALTPPVETALQAALSVVVSGLAPSPPKDALSVPPLSRERFLRLALSGDGQQIAAALKGLGRAVLDRLRRGVVDDLDRLDTLALAVCLGRLARTIPQSPSNPVASSRRGAGPTARPALARSVHGGRRW